MDGNGFAEGYAVGQGNNNFGYGGFGGFGGDWIAIIAIFALLGGGFGFGGGWGGNRGNCATQADLAAGFANSEIMSDLNDILLAQSQGFANVQQTLCQGFSGLNFNLATDTCKIVETVNAGTQKILDYMQCKENQDLRDKLQTAQFQLSQLGQNAYLLGELRPVARPAYITCSPYESVYGARNAGCGCGCGGNGYGF